MADTTICPGESLALSIKACTTREQIRRVAEHADRIKGGLTAHQKQLVIDAVLNRTRELANELHFYSVDFMSKF